ncbi:coproporphyrinogen III oxidase, aerobic [Phycomyces blakesleeanus]|uniref:coproporphyrinogen oxidase n=2 Tax=Phycomyces blakesleeanus TaxID=4837 RepID=A0A162TFI0_PHYB8|nr:hypothetical protein PHYBLDRAFT_137228 [Phycomyces blakesleeanus NRRL 1555(-)]OAD66723.1 hypothetical protein PHYBLDRAFT_137228 [Phycomyces blakesleeanus NRRL 1555(-)]|eukprot:XP_018284763.1 hypothetical protein PHYBLDRAFT_137228 [Phycomyces blakesleeanus NRRL 1555(-)]
MVSNTCIQSISRQDTLRRSSGEPLTNKDPIRLRHEAFVKNLQNSIVKAIEQVDGGKFERTSWQRAEHGGEGITCVLQDGAVIEKAGVAVSVVYSELSDTAIQQMRQDRGKSLEGQGPFPYFVTGISLVMHGKNPHCPTVHMNYRYFEVMNPDGSTKLWWFGGGADLTPVYLYEEDAVHFHAVHKAACDKHDLAYYPKFKPWCDTYFKNAHRGEGRGVGGIFFDDLADKPAEQIFAFVQDCGNSFVDAYVPILKKRKDHAYDDEQVRWQQIRRGRYVEFNLIWDRGTRFGLHTPCARVESILMTLPLTVRWEYMHEPKEGSIEARLEQVLKTPVDWIPLK